ncbi:MULTISPECIES: hypothetical protein [unclassified Halorubrum]|uniref:hypothetical protein n=1 Tax=unclassified Halorubrum TaxID=2642239 RepID=UPI0011C37858|nr:MULTISPECIES: hypothetical protein [unclassified Halorubrum]
MPIEKDSDEWAEGNIPVRREQLVIDFLSSHPTKAFTLRELANELGIADWDAAARYERDREQMDPKKFEDKYPRDEFHPTEITESDPTREMYHSLRRLDEMDLVKIREVSPKAFDEGIFIPQSQNDEVVTAVAYSADQE